MSLRQENIDWRLLGEEERTRFDGDRSVELSLMGVIDERRRLIVADMESSSMGAALVTAEVI